MFEAVGFFVWPFCRDLLGWHVGPDPTQASALLCAAGLQRASAGEAVLDTLRSQKYIKWGYFWMKREATIWHRPLQFRVFAQQGLISALHLHTPDLHLAARTSQIWQKQEERLLGITLLLRKGILCPYFLQVSCWVNKLYLWAKDLKKSMAPLNTYCRNAPLVWYPSKPMTCFCVSQSEIWDVDVHFERLCTIFTDSVSKILGLNKTFIPHS